MRAYLLTPVIAGLLLSGCAEWDSIYRKGRLPNATEGGVYTVDAKQRHLVVVPDNDDRPQWRVCAEAAPDVFSAFASSFGAQGNKDGGQLSLAVAETAATIERTQTINMLRESFYRTCERYASGAINRPQFIIQAARDQRAMVTILAVEQLTGALRPRSTIIAPGGTAANTLSGERAAALLSSYQTRLDKATADRDEAKAKLTEAEKDDGVCKDATKAGDCQALKTTLSDREKDVVDAKKALDNVISLAKDLVSATTASTSGTSLQGNGISQSDISSANLATVSWAVTKIVSMANINEPLMACIAWLTDKSGAGADITKTCTEILKAQQQQDDSLLKSLTVDGMNSFVSGIKAAEDYKAFRSQLIARLEAVSDQKFGTNLAKFEEALGGDHFLSSAPQCQKRADCLKFAMRDGNDPYKTSFHKDSARAMAALTKLSE